MMIKNVYIKSNVEIINTNSGIGALRKKGILVIEDTNDNKQILDLTNMSDITSCKHIIVKDTKKTRVDYVFKNLLYDIETLEKLAKKR